MPESKYDQISIQFTKPGSGDPAFKVDNWTSYSFESDYFNPVDSFSFELGDDRVDQLINKIRIGDPVELIMWGRTQCKGLIEKVDFDYSVNGGTVLKLSGRDILGTVCDGTISPNIKITDTNTFEDALLKAFEGAGWSKDKIAFVNFSDQANFKPETSQKGSGRKKREKIGHQLKPHKNEGFMEFAMRICKRSGWNIKLTPDGQYIHIGMPTYDITDVDGTFCHKLSDQIHNNILSSSVAIDWRKQPSYIIGEATGAGGNFRKGINSVFVPNALLLDQDDIILYGYSHMSEKKIKWVNANPMLTGNLPTLLKNLFPGKVTANTAEANQKLRPLFEYDDESKSMAELQYVMTKKMADFQNNFFSLDIVTNGHSFVADGVHYVDQINTMCHVIDETYGLDNDFWIQRRVFTKSRSSGTRTQLTLKLPYIYVFEEVL